MSLRLQNISLSCDGSATRQPSMLPGCTYNIALQCRAGVLRNHQFLNEVSMQCDFVILNQWSHHY